MTLKTITFEFASKCGKQFRTFTDYGLYWMQVGDEYRVYKVWGVEREHEEIASYAQSSVIKITESII